MRWNALVLLVVVAGCAQDSVCEHAGEAALEVGIGLDAFAPLAPGDELPVHLGVAGGWVSWVGIRAQGIHPGSEEDIERYFGEPREPDAAGAEDQPLVSYTLSSANGQISGLARHRRPLEPDGEALLRSGDPIPFFQPCCDPDDIHGATATLSATIEDACGRVASAEKEVTLVVIDE